MRKSYSEKLRDPRWQKKRLSVLERDDWTCQKCRDKETELQVHHLKYHENPWDTPKKDLITLCKDCHLEIEAMKKAGIFKKAKFSDIKILKKKSFTDDIVMMVTAIRNICVIRVLNGNIVLSDVTISNPSCKEIGDLLLKTANNNG